jgi:hypothetical protein
LCKLIPENASFLDFVGHVDAESYRRFNASADR